VVAWVLILGSSSAWASWSPGTGNGNVLGDHTIPHWFAAHRTPGGDSWSLIFSTLGATQAILIVSLATCVVFSPSPALAPVVFIAAVMTGELTAFLIAATVVKRSRPDVPRLDHALPTSAYPSGHEARPAACTSRWPSWSSATPAAGGGGCS
jgi:undecaprenyl-diphosphatase